MFYFMLILGHGKFEYDEAISGLSVHTNRIVNHAGCLEFKLLVVEMNAKSKVLVSGRRRTLMHSGNICSPGRTLPRFLAVEG